MKKFFAIALAMAMVLSLGSALAATWGNPNANTASPAAVTISVTKYVELRDAANNPYYSRLDDAAIVKANDPVAFQVKISVPSAGSLNNQFNTTAFNDGDTLAVKIDGTNLKNAINGGDIGFNDGFTLTVHDAATTYYLQKARGAGTPSAVTTAEMYLDKASEYGAVDLKVNVRFISALGDITMRSGDAKFYVDSATAYPGSTYSGTCYIVDGTYRTGAYVYFQTNSSSNVKVMEIYVSIDGCVMKVVRTDGIYQCDTTAVAGAYSDSAKFAGDDFLNRVLSVLGFSAYDALYNGTVYMDNTNWAQNFGVYFNNSNSATYAPYTPVPVVVTPVTTPTTTIPKTGGNASVIGFSLVAMAVIAAAVVVLKKVRA